VHSVTTAGPLDTYITIDRAASGLQLPFGARASFTPDAHVAVTIHADGYSAATFRPSRCPEVPPAAATPRPATATLYYGESGEPWAAARDGTLPDRWRELATAALTAVGIHPITMEVVRPIPFDVAAFDRCVVPQCGNGFILAVTMPHAERERAFARCFFLGDGTTYVPGASARGNADYYNCEAF